MTVTLEDLAAGVTERALVPASEYWSC